MGTAQLGQDGMEMVAAWLILLAAGVVGGWGAYRYRKAVGEAALGALAGIAALIAILLVSWALVKVILSD